MSRLVVYLIIITLITGCLNRKKEKKDVVRQDMVVVNDKDVLRDDLAVELGRFVDWHSRVSDIDSIKGICYTVEFFNENFIMFTEKDTIIILSYYAHGVDTIGYKGILFVDDYPVAVLDKDTIGLVLYDERSLIEVPLTRFNRIKYRVRPVARFFRLEHGKLKRVLEGIHEE